MLNSVNVMIFIILHVKKYDVRCARTHVYNIYTALVVDRCTRSDKNGNGMDMRVCHVVLLTEDDRSKKITVKK